MSNHTENSLKAYDDFKKYFFRHEVGYLARHVSVSVEVVGIRRLNVIISCYGKPFRFEVTESNNGKLYSGDSFFEAYDVFYDKEPDR